MSPNPIKQSIETAIAYLTSHPDEARYIDSAAVATLESGLRFRVSDPDGRTITTDMPKGVGGEGMEPGPGWLFRAALASCIGSLVAMRAAQTDVKFSVLEVTVDSESDDRGILGMDETVSAGPLSMRVSVKMEAQGAGEEVYRELAEWALAHCPVADAVGSAVELKLELQR
jgi:uncharacterized OsmC-like protein